MNTKIQEKQNFNTYYNQYQDIVVITSFLLMIIGFLIGRAILSFGIFIFFLNALINLKYNKIEYKIYWYWGLTWIGLYFLSYLWSEDILYWKERIEVKFAIILIPFSFSLIRRLEINKLSIFTLIYSLISILACIYSLYFYFTNYDQIVSSIFFSKVLKTPAYGDHIRFSIFIAINIIWLFYWYPNFKTKLLKGISIAFITFFSIYLHILAVRSGLLVLYVFLALFFIYILFTQKVKVSIMIFTIFVLGVIGSYQLIPTFKEKLRYIQYTYEVYNENPNNVNFSDIGRIVSYKLAWMSIEENPIIGVGAGDIRQAMKEKYLIYAPNTKPEQMIVPHNQILEVLLAGGGITLIPFLIWLFYPLKYVQKNRDGFFLFITWFTLFLCLLVEAMLEVQFGVFIYSFSLMLMIHVVTTNENNTKEISN